MVTIDGLSFGYGRGTLFKELALGLRPGQHLRAARRQRRGKSTLLKLMSGLLFATSGTVRSLGHDPAARRPSFLADVFVLPEDAQAPSMSARAYVRSRAPFYPRFRSGAVRPLSARARAARERGSLAALSHGQQKKFLLAFGLASQAKLVLLDEPTNGLDIPVEERLLRRVIAEARDAPSGCS